MDLDDIPMKRTVLVVDDEELLRHYVARVIANEGYRVFVAGDGLDALALFDIGAPPIDLVITDIKMPVMDGIETTRRIVSQYPNIRVLVLTTFENDGYVVQALKAGASGYLLKDSQPEAIVSAMLGKSDPKSALDKAAAQANDALAVAG